jgi:hypothetical protein
VGGERREKIVGLMHRKQNSRGLGEKVAKTYSSKGQNRNI